MLYFLCTQVPAGLFIPSMAVGAIGGRISPNILCLLFTQVPAGLFIPSMAVGAIGGRISPNIYACCLHRSQQVYLSPAWQLVLLVVEWLVCLWSSWLCKYEILAWLHSVSPYLL